MKHKYWYGGEISVKTFMDKKFFRFQEKPGWCAIACVQMVLLASGIKKTQKEISKYIYFDWWGTSDDMMVAYLSQFFTKLGSEMKSSLAEVEKHLKEGHFVIANWWDDLDPEEPEGHYTLVLDYDKSKKALTLADPSTNRGIWKMNEADFVKRWYDFWDVGKRIKAHSPIIWIDPSSKI